VEWNADDGRRTDERGLNYFTYSTLICVNSCLICENSWISYLKLLDGTQMMGEVWIADCGLRIADCGLRIGTRMMGEERMNADD
jgi:hypothetical protein